MTATERLAELGLTLPPVAPPVAAYVPAVRTGNYVYTSGQLPLVDGKLQGAGKVGDGVAPTRRPRSPASPRLTRSRRPPAWQAVSTPSRGSSR